MPGELQAALSGGQYITIGLQKNWKMRPALTHKNQILSYCSRPGANPNRVRQILQLRIGIEMSACTSNMRRVTLAEALRLAYPEEQQKVEDACNTGDPMSVCTYLSDLEATGLSHEGHGQFFWPLSRGIP